MAEVINVSIFILLSTSLLVLMLEVIGNKNRPSFSEKPHIRLLALSALFVPLVLIFIDLIENEQLGKRPLIFVEKIGSLFLIINTAIAIFISKKTLSKNQNGEIYFLILAALALAISNINHPSLILKLLASTAWLILMTTLAIRSTPGGKRAEIGLKLTFSTIIFILQFLFAIWLFYYSNLPLNLNIITAKTSTTQIIGFIALILLALSCLSLTGTPPFHFGHIDCADGGNITAAFLLLSNSFVQGGVLLLHIKAALLRSGFDISQESNVLGLMLIIGFMILWLRALDQSKIRRTIAYIATSIGPLFFMSLLFGTSALLPKLIFLLAIFSFVTLALFTLYGSLAFMEPINLPWQTWEEISGFGRIRPWQTLTFLVAIASIAGLPGTFGYFIKLSLIAPLKDNIIFSGSIFLSIAIGAACVMRFFVFMYSKQTPVDSAISHIRPPRSLMITSIILIALGFFPFIR